MLTIHVRFVSVCNLLEQVSSFSTQYIEFPDITTFMGCPGFEPGQSQGGCVSVVTNQKKKKHPDITFYS